MNSTQINTITDMAEAIGNAISERDTKAFDLAQDIARDWLITEDERNALMTLIEAAREATWALVDWEAGAFA